MEGMSASDAAPAVMAAMLEAGRDREAQALAARMLQRLDADVGQGVPAANVAYSRAMLLAMVRRKSEALDQLELAAAKSWTLLSAIPYQPLGQHLAFRSLAAEPRLQALQRRLDQAVDGQRALLHLPPLAGK
jgi:hypothetical protein